MWIVVRESSTKGPEITGPFENSRKASGWAFSKYGPIRFGHPTWRVHFVNKP